MTERRLRAAFASASALSLLAVVSTALAQREAPPSQPPWVMLPAVPSSSAAAPNASSAIAPQAPPASSGAPALPPASAAPAAPPPPPPAYGVPAYPPPAYPPPAYGAYPPPRYVYEPPPPDYVPYYTRPGYHMHAGFYFRFGIGIGVMNARATLPYTVTTSGTSSVTSTTNHFTAPAIAFDAAIGGALTKGFILAADLGGHGADALSTSGTAPAYGKVTSLSYSRLGILADWYVNPRRGFHVQGGVGFGWATLGYGDGSADTLAGTQANVGVGWEGWVGSDLGIGALLRLDMASMKQTIDVGDQTMTLFTPSVMFTMTFN